MNEEDLRDVLRERLNHSPEVDAPWREVQRRVSERRSWPHTKVLIIGLAFGLFVLAAVPLVLAFRPQPIMEAGGVSPYSYTLWPPSQPSPPDANALLTWVHKSLAADDEYVVPIAQTTEDFKIDPGQAAQESCSGSTSGSKSPYACLVEGVSFSAPGSSTRVDGQMVTYNKVPVWLVVQQDTSSRPIGGVVTEYQGPYTGVTVVDARTGAHLEGILLPQEGGSDRLSSELGGYSPDLVQQTIVIWQGGGERTVFEPPPDGSAERALTSWDALAAYHQVNPGDTETNDSTAQLGLFTSASGLFTERLAWGYSSETGCPTPPNHPYHGASQSPLGNCISWLFLDATTGEMLEALYEPVASSVSSTP
jgi:hypothetical protein